MTPPTSTLLQERETGVEELVHKLKLQWVMTGDEAEKRRISGEIRRRLLQPIDK